VPIPNFSFGLGARYKQQILAVKVKLAIGLSAGISRVNLWKF